MNFLQKRKLNSLRKRVQKLHDLVTQQSSDANAKAAITAQYDLAKFYEQHSRDRGLQHADTYALECYRASASLGDIKAHYICGQRILEQAKFWDAWSHNPIYGASIHQKYANAFYSEAFAYLEFADEHNFALAKRLLGMAYIHGWGTTMDLDKGYQLVLASIDLEQAWDRATKIFEELKLNSPQFFAKLRTYRGNP